MLVDPNTGEIIGSSGGGSIGGYGADAMAQFGSTQMQAMQALQAAPGMFVSSFFNAQRGGTTLLGGGFRTGRTGRMRSLLHLPDFRDKRGPAGRTRNLLNFNRFSDPINIGDPYHHRPGMWEKLHKINTEFTEASGAVRATGDTELAEHMMHHQRTAEMRSVLGLPKEKKVNKKLEQYTPFNFLADIGNAGFEPALTYAQKIPGVKGIASRLSAKMTHYKLMGDEAAPTFGAGTLARSNIISRIGRKGFNEGRGALLGNLTRLDPMVGGSLTELSSAGDFGLGIASSSAGRVSQFGLAYQSAWTNGKPTQDAMTHVMSMGPMKEASVEGSELAARHLERLGIEHTVSETGAVTRTVGKESILLGEKYGMEEGAKVGMGTLGKVVFKEGLTSEAGRAALGGAAAIGLEKAAYVVPVVGWAMMAVDAADMAGHLAIAGMEAGKEALHSFKGSIDKPIMGMGWKDNSVSATSRSRGVAAIQNSRLNARSILGSEAGALHAHFG